MDKHDLRDPQEERRVRLRHLFAVVGVGLFVTAAAVAAVEQQRPNDHRYTFFVSFGTSNGVPHTVLLPLPSEPALRGAIHVVGDVTSSTEPSSQGLVLRVYSTLNVTAYADKATWENFGIALTTEGLSANARPAVRLFLDSDGTAAGCVFLLRISKTDTSWTEERTVHGELVEGWNTLEVVTSKAKPLRP